MRRNLFRLFLAVSIPLTITSLLLAQDSTSCRPLVSTTGSAEVRVVPDLADLAFQVEARNTDLTKARNEQAERMSRVLTTLRNAGVKNSELQTSQVEIVPHYDNRAEAPFSPTSGRPSVESVTARFYSVSQSVACTLHDVKKVANVTADAVTAGVTGVREATLRTSELRKYRDQARAQAVRAAKEKAVALAGELAAKVGRPFTITESASEGWGMLNSVPQQRAVSVGGDDGEESTFAPGMISISARVSVSFILE